MVVDSEVEPKSVFDMGKSSFLKLVKKSLDKPHVKIWMTVDQGIQGGKGRGL